MRKIIVSIHSTLNGVVTGPAHDPTNFMIWADAGIKDTTRDFAKNFDTVDTVLLGRGTYEDLSRKWPFAKDWPNVTEDALRIADIFNTMPKLVVSGSRIENPKWGDFDPPAQLTGGDIEEQIKALKNQDGRNIITFGSPRLVQSLTNADLIDEYRILIHPVVVGEGGRLFEHISGRKDLKLLSTQTFKHGAALMRYELVKS